MYVAIVGSRDFPQLERVRDFVRRLAAKYPDVVIVSGGARGVDSAAEEAALAAGLSVISFRPIEMGQHDFKITRYIDGRAQGSTGATSYSSYGRAAFARNGLIVRRADQVVAFTTGSKGTAHSLKIAAEEGIPTHVFGVA